MIIWMGGGRGVEDRRVGVGCVPLFDHCDDRPHVRHLATTFRHQLGGEGAARCEGAKPEGFCLVMPRVSSTPEWVGYNP